MGGRSRENIDGMEIRKIVRKTFRDKAGGVTGAVNAAIAANVDEPARSHTHVSSRQRVVHRSGRTEVHEESATRRSTDPENG
jgi:hypothetical protein